MRPLPVFAVAAVVILAVAIAASLTALVVRDGNEETPTPTPTPTVAPTVTATATATATATQTATTTAIPTPTRPRELLVPERDLKEAVVSIEVFGRGLFFCGSRTSGTGFVVDSARGLVATAYHLFSGFADDNCEHSVTVFDGRRIGAQLVATDERHDLAILRLSTTRALNELPLQRVRDVQVEDLALAFSYASGPGHPPLMTTGHVISEPYACINTLGLGAGDGILVDTDVNPGFSGGPIVNAHGEVVGVITGSREGFFMGDDSCAVPASYVVTLLSQAAAE